MGCAEDTRTVGPALPGCAQACDLDGACGSRPTRHGRASQAAAQQADGDGAFPLLSAQRAVVRRLQGRVHARRPALLLSVDDHRLSYAGLPDLDYPFHDKAVIVTTCG